MKLSPFLERRARAIAAIAAAEAPIRQVTFPGVRVKGTTNGSQGVTIAGRRARRGQQRGLRSLGNNAARMLGLPKLAASRPLVVRIVRVAPNRLDGDNLEASLKRVRDGVALAVGIDDRSPAVEYVADDERGAVREYAIRFEVYPQRDELREALDAGAMKVSDNLAELARVRTQAAKTVAALFPRLTPNTERPAK